jgi:aryl sulfotransferase
VFDSARWAAWRPRPDDIIIATYSKSGTTWMQRIVHMMIFQDAAPAPIQSPWFDVRLLGPVESVAAMAEEQTHRRYLKAHLPYDALPIAPGVKIIHVARDGRDAAMSLHNHFVGFSAIARARYAEINRDDPKFAGATADVPADPGAYFRSWLDVGGGGRGDDGAGYFYVENSFWAVRRDPDVLLVHYNDLKRDRSGEMQRIARFLGLDIPEPTWSAIVEAAGFEAMRRDGAVIMPVVEVLWDGGAERFIYKGTSGRWQECVPSEEIARYEAMLAARCPPALAAWLTNGRGIAGDPESTPD